jgi:hypothetical protein
MMAQYEIIVALLTAICFGHFPIRIYFYQNNKNSKIIYKNGLVTAFSRQEVLIAGIEVYCS